MNSLRLALKKQPIVYIARDLERAFGLSETYENYHIITNATPFAKQILASRSKNFQANQQLVLIEDALLRDTHELLTHPQTVGFLKKLKNPALLVFKNTKVLETLCDEHGYHLLNPSAQLSQIVEEKISQLTWLQGLTHLLPPYYVAPLKEVTFSDIQGKILQFNRAHTGNGTMRISDESHFIELQKKFPLRPVRITDFIDGPMLTNNNVVWKNHILCGPLSYQITGTPPFTDRIFATIGNDWAFPSKLLSEKLREDYQNIATAVGKKLASDGWKGLFGIDVVFNQKNQTLYLIEINARQPASTTYESQLQTLVNSSITDPAQITTFEAHLLSLLDSTYEGHAILPLTEGAQIIQRVRENLPPPLSDATNVLRSAGLTVIPYTNTKPGDDLLRIQSRYGLIKDHGVFNERGNFIAHELSNVTHKIV